MRKDRLVGAVVAMTFWVIRPEYSLTANKSISGNWSFHHPPDRKILPAELGQEGVS